MQPCGWQTKSSWTANQASRPDRVTVLSWLIYKVASRVLCSDTTASRNKVCQNVNAGGFKPLPPLSVSILTPVLELHRFSPWSHDLFEGWPKSASWEASHDAGEIGCLPWVLFFPLEKLEGQGGSPGKALCLPSQRGLILLKWNHFSNLSNAVLISPCGPGECYSLLPGLQFHRGIRPMHSG